MGVTRYAQIRFKENPKTRRLQIAGGPGFIENIFDDGRITAIYTDHIFGPAGPYEVTEEDFEVVKKHRG